MSSSPKDLVAARKVWAGLPPRSRGELARALVPAEQQERARALLTTILVRSHLTPSLPDPASETVDFGPLVGRACGPLFEPPADGSAPAFAGAYAEELLAQLLPLVGVDELEHRRLGELLERAHAHAVLAPLAFESAAIRMAEALWHALGDDLLAKAVELAGRSARPRSAFPWMDRPERLFLSVDHVTLSCARYLAGLQTPGRDRYGYDELWVGSAGRAKRVDQVTVGFEAAHPQQPKGEPEVHADQLGSELKAKLFVALFALAAQAKAHGDPSPNRVRLRDLLGMLGFELGRFTNSTYYWRYASQLTRHMLVDLPSRVVAMQLSIAGERQPRVVFEPLLERVRPLSGRGEPFPAEASRLLWNSLLCDEEEASAALRRSGVEGFEFAVSDELLEAHGIGSRLNAIEHVPVEVLSLRGPAFWLAWHVAFLRRWASLPTTGAGGKPLLRALEDTGHLAACSRNGRVRYKDALSFWWRDAGRLAGMGLLDEPGVRLYGKRGGSWREISNEVSRRLDSDGGRLTRPLLQDIRVVYQIPGTRIAQLDAARQRARKRTGVNPRSGGRRERW
ncbi:MAG TPA: hypothetical protein VF168_14435 [Trueperaceae bacterium]